MMLDVFLRDRPLGTYRNEGDPVFTYQDEAFDRQIPFSLSLPLQSRTYTGLKVKVTVENLVPDRTSDRRTLAELAELPSDDPAVLLSYFGQDCIGAVRFQSRSHDSLPETPEDDRVPLDKSDVAHIIDSFDDAPSGEFDGDPIKLSLTGTQSKTGVIYDSATDQWWLPRGRSPSTHIMKPPLDNRYFDSHINEHLSLRVADTLGIPVVKTRVQTINGREVLLLNRFDRIRNTDGSIRRIHQEDFARAMGRGPSLRYPIGARDDDAEVDSDQYEDGVNKALALLRDYSDTPRRDQRLFIKSQVIQWVIGSTDGHFKNYGLYLESNQGDSDVGLTPFYDMASTEPYNQSNPATDAQDLTYVTDQGIEKPFDHPMRLAMPIGIPIRFHMDDIEPVDFVDCYYKPGCLLDRATIESDIRDVFNSINDALETLHSTADSLEFEPSRLNRLVEPIQAGVEDRARRLAKYFECDHQSRAGKKRDHDKMLDPEDNP